MPQRVLVEVTLGGKPEMSRLTWATVIAITMGCGSSIGAREIVYESEYQVLVKQHGEKWAAEDRLPYTLMVMASKSAAIEGTAAVLT